MALFGRGGDQYEDLSQATEDAQSQIQEYYEQATSFMQPWQTAGVGGLEAWQAGLEPLAKPQDVYAQLLEGYQLSPQAQFEQQQALEQSIASGAATGMLGSGASAKALADYTQQLSSRDIQNYINNISRIYGGYLGGESGLAGMGEQAAGTMGGWAMGAGQSLADLTQQLGQISAMQEAQRQRGALGAITGATGMVAPYFMPGTR